MSLLLIVILVFIVWKWLSNNTRTIIKGTVNRAGEDTLLAANKGLDTVEETLGIDDEYKKEVLAKYSS
jgi:hypothetical protein